MVTMSVWLFIAIVIAALAMGEAVGERQAARNRRARRAHLRVLPVIAHDEENWVDVPMWQRPAKYGEVGPPPSGSPWGSPFE